MRIAKLFKEAAENNQKLFIPYLTCGDPSLKETAALVKDLEKLGASCLELGVPFSDPLGDGLSNQLSAQRALKNKVSLKDCCHLVKDLRDQGSTLPLLLFTYLNPLLNLGYEAFADLAQASGVDAVLIVDLPIEEAEDLLLILKKRKIGIVFLVTPTTTEERIIKTAALEPEFIYYVSRCGVTGTREELPENLEQDLAKLRACCPLPIAVGFGISTRKQVETVMQMAEGVIVGSALVKELPLGSKRVCEVAAELLGF